MRPPFIIGLDVDEVLAQLHAPWIVWGNRKFGTSYTEFLAWEDPYAWWGKEESLRFLTADIYDQDIVKPYPWALAAVDALRSRGHGIRFITSAAPGTESAKFNWLVRHGFAKDGDEYITMLNKTNAPCHLLVDDGWHNVSTFNGWAILVTRSHNANDLWFGKRINHVGDLLNIL